MRAASLTPRKYLPGTHQSNANKLHSIPRPAGKRIKIKP
jgi:hypothetical protein